MKIALLHPNLDVKSGAERQVLQLALGLKEKGHEVTLYVSKLDAENCFPELIQKFENSKEIENESSGKIIECGGYGYKDMKKMILLSPYYMWKMARRVLKDINSGDSEYNYNLIHCHNYPSTYAAVKIKREIKKELIKKKSLQKEPNMPIVWMCNEPPFPPLFYGEKTAKTISSWFYRLVVAPFLIYNKLIVKEIDQILVLDQMNFERIKLTYNCEPTIAHTGLDFPTSLPSSSTNEETLINEEKDPNHFVILCTGRIDQGKRTEDAIRAISQLKDKIPNILLKIAGGGSKLEEMKQLAEKLNLGTFVKFYGRVNDQKLQELYSSCDIFLFTAENQSWGLVPLEAMSYGKPCLVSTGAGVAGVLTDKEHCLKITPRDVKGIVENVLWLHEQPQKSQEMALNGQRFVKENFSWVKYVERMEEIFLRIIDFKNTNFIYPQKL